jgi:hypothetical protein
MPSEPRQLYRELRACQQRLGTATELSDDFDRVLRIAHELNNQIAANYLCEAAELDDIESVSLRAVSRRMLGQENAVR